MGSTVTTEFSISVGPMFVLLVFYKISIAFKRTVFQLRVWNRQTNRLTDGQLLRPTLVAGRLLFATVGYLSTC